MFDAVANSSDDSSYFQFGQDGIKKARPLKVMKTPAKFKNMDSDTPMPKKSPKKSKKSTLPKPGYEAVLIDGEFRMRKLCKSPKRRDPYTYRCRSPPKPPGIAEAVRKKQESPAKKEEVVRKE